MNTNTFCFSDRSRENLQGVHPDLITLVKRALEISANDFAVIEGVRSAERQREMVAKGASRTLNSRHLTGHAVDLAPWVKGIIPWDDWQAFEEVARAMKQASAERGIPITWGGDWLQLRDGPHFELPRAQYP